MPYFGDRHTCEFFSCYITDLKAMDRYRLIRTSVSDRRKDRLNRRERIASFIDGEIPKSFLKRSRETAASIISAHATGKSFTDVGNVPNIGQISNLPEGTVVESAVQVDPNGFTPLTFGPLPQPVLGFTMPYSYSYKMLVDACFERDKTKA